MKRFWILGIFLALFPFFVHGNKCPPPEDIMPCRCRSKSEQIQVWCSHSDLERVNSALENLMILRSMPAIDELIVENNRMPTLPARAFGALRIGRLLLRNNGLESFSRNAFAGLEDSIEELYIVEDKLVDFPFDSIENLKNLEAFTLERSQIRLLPRFNGLNRLKHIRIDGSLISSFPVGAFASMGSIKQIHVVNSQVGALAEGIFGSLDTLLLANFSGNRLDLIQRRSFALLPKLEVLSLANNNLDNSISVGRACEELTSLKSLDLSHNKFSLLPEGSFVNLRTLQMLNLGSNKIMQVNTRSFTHLPALRKVDLSDNLIRNLPPKFFDTAPLLEELRMRRNLLGTANEIGEVLSSLKSLRFLDLGENGLTVLPSGAIQDHTQLQRLDLSDNKIQRIQRSAFNNVPSLIEMSLRNNSIMDLTMDGGEAWDIPSLKELDMSNNNLQVVSSVALKGIPRIARIDLSYNSIKSVGKGVFLHNKDLELLDMTGNGLNSFSSDALIGLSKLNKLDLSRNHLESIQSGTFRELKSLQTLNMASNRISNVPANLFNDLKSLEELSLKSNSLNHIPAGFFSALENLKELNLKHNSISEVHGRMLTGLKSLETLKMSSNQISRFDDIAFDDMFKLKVIDISSNRINRVPGRSFRNLANLEKFEARENRIISVDAGALSNSEKLQVLDLAHNALTVVPDIIKSNPTLKVVDLSHNQINKVEPDAFKRSKHLVELYLNDNKIKALPAKTFENLDTLTILDMDGNEVEEIAGDTFKNLPKLIYLRLSKNKIKAVRNAAFTDLPALDGLDLQENDVESIGDSAFEKTGALKYLNLSNNNFDSMARMGLFPLQSLEVLDLSFNRIRDVDPKALKHLQWLVELRLNDNGICRLPVGVFDRMSRLKMLVVRNNLLTHLYESVFYKLKNNIAFLDISGNPINCDCELTWLRNLVTREAVQELVDSTCEAPSDLKGKPIKELRPSRFICTNNVISRGIPPTKYEDEPCPALPKSKRKPRPVLLESNERPFFGTNPAESSNDYLVEGESDNNDIRKKPDDKMHTDSDYTPGDTPTIYASSGSNPKVSKDQVKSSGFGALGTLFGFPLPSLDFGIDLGITPSLTAIHNKKPTNKNDEDRSFTSGSGTIKGPDPLPASWVDRPSKGSDFGAPGQTVYEPPEYIPRKPIQPYIPLNPFSDTNVMPSGSRDVQKAVSPLSGSSNGNGPLRPVKFPPVEQTNKHGNNKNQGSRPGPPGSWHPAYPTAETGFIPIEPFFHSVTATNAKKASSNNNLNRNNNNNNNRNNNGSTNNNGPVRDDISSGSSTYYSTTSRPNAEYNSQKHPQKVTTLPAFSNDFIPAPAPSPSSPSSSSSSSNLRPTDSLDLSPSPSPSSNHPVDYDDDPNYTPVSIQTSPDRDGGGSNGDEDKMMLDNDDFSLSDFWGMFSGKDNMSMDAGHEIDMDKIPLNFSNPIDTVLTTGSSSTSTPPPRKIVHAMTTETASGLEFNGNSNPEEPDHNFGTENHNHNHNNHQHHPNHNHNHDAHPRRPLGKPTITKITMEDAGVAFSPNSNPNKKIPPINPLAEKADRIDNQEILKDLLQNSNPQQNSVKGEPSQPQQLIPPVIIGNREEPLDWYYTNYNSQNHGDELEKFLERSRINQMEDIVVDVSSSSSSLSALSKIYLPQTLSLLVFNFVYFTIRYL